ncbi:MAG: outer membrane lipoprotein carrier protein LolA [Nitrospiraceae bacterium]|nr:outer membrane lipoprotein carrier protein LolA [Nitrospiraceae bacterium]
MRITNFLLSALIIFFAAAPASAQQDIADAIQDSYIRLKDIRGNFVQKSYIKDLKRTDTYKGRFFIKPPRMKWEYLTEKPQTIYVIKDEITIYQKTEKQAFVSRFDSATYGQAPIALLGGFGKIKNEFITTEKDGKLILKPKRQMGNITSIEITAGDGDFPIKSMVITDNRSNRTEINLSSIKTDTGIKDSLFDFIAPEGVTVIRN